MKRVRTELGLSYGVYGGVSPGRVRGTNYVFVQTKAASSGAAIDESIAVLEELQTKAPSGEELQEKKSAITNSFIFNFNSKDEVASRLASHELMDYPVDYDKTYLAKINSVQPADIAAVAASRWDPTRLVIVVVGNETALEALKQEQAKPESRLRKFDLVKLSFDEAVQKP
jgi:zinc protease